MWNASATWSDGSWSSPAADPGPTSPAGTRRSIRPNTSDSRPSCSCSNRFRLVRTRMSRSVKDWNVPPAHRRRPAAWPGRWLASPPTARRRGQRGPARPPDPGGPYGVFDYGPHPAPRARPGTSTLSRRTESRRCREPHLYARRSAENNSVTIPVLSLDDRPVPLRQWLVGLWRFRGVLRRPLPQGLPGPLQAGHPRRPVVRRPAPAAIDRDGVHLLPGGRLRHRPRLQLRRVRAGRHGAVDLRVHVTQRRHHLDRGRLGAHRQGVVPPGHPGPGAAVRQPVAAGHRRP